MLGLLVLNEGLKSKNIDLNLPICQCPVLSVRVSAVTDAQPPYTHIYIQCCRQSKIQSRLGTNVAVRKPIAPLSREHNYDERTGLFSSYEIIAERESRKETYLAKKMQSKLSLLIDQERLREGVEARAAQEREHAARKDRRRQEAKLRYRMQQVCRCDIASHDCVWDCPRVVSCMGYLD
jgi:hypothetical protein